MTIDRAMEDAIERLEDARQALETAKADIERLWNANKRLAAALDAATLGGLAMPWVQDNQKRERVVAERCIQTFYTALTESTNSGEAFTTKDVIDAGAMAIRELLGCSPANLETKT